MKYTLFSIFLVTNGIFAQGAADSIAIVSMQDEIARMQIDQKELNSNFWNENKKMNERFNDLSEDFEKQSSILRALVYEKDSLLAKVTALNSELEKNAKSVEANNEKINTEQIKTEQNFLYTIIGILAVLFIVIVIYLMTQRRANSIEQKTGDLDASAADLKNQLSNLSARTSEDLASALEKFANIATAQPVETESDHTMVKEFAKQIISIENTMSRMDANDRGLRRIKHSVDKMHDTLKTMDYEITPLLGTNVSEGQKIDVEEQKIDETVAPGMRTIVNVLKAEILYKGVQIQRAQVEIKKNPND